MTLSIVSIAVSCLAVSGCRFSPKKIEKWYIRHIIENDTVYYIGDHYNGTRISSDYLVFSFKEDGTVTINDLDGNVRKGAFTEKATKRASRRATGVTVNLSDGTCLTGSCEKFAFDGVWYEFILSDGNVTYELTDKNDWPSTTFSS